MDFQLKDEYLQILEELKLNRTRDFLLVSIQNQSMYLQKENKAVKTYVISTSLKKPSCQQNSFGTPWGLHEVSDIIGSDQPSGMVFKARKPIGKCYWDCGAQMQEGNLITSRILRLRGMQSGLNHGGFSDTFSRFVYIHGTNHENKLGQPASSGCLQVSNQDVIELADTIKAGTHLFISLLY